MHPNHGGGTSANTGLFVRGKQWLTSLCLLAALSEGAESRGDIFREQNTREKEQAPDGGARGHPAAWVVPARYMVGHGGKAEQGALTWGLTCNTVSASLSWGAAGFS